MSAKRESRAWPTAATFYVATAILLSGCISDSMSGDFNVTVIGGPPAEPVPPPPYTGPLYVIETDPEANETWVPPDNVVIRARFTHAVNPATFTPSMFTVTDNAGIGVAGQATCFMSAVEFRPSSPLDSFARYSARIEPAMRDFSGNLMLSGHTWSFSTGPSGTGAWRAMNTTGAPEARQGGSAVWTGAEMVVWGGAVYSADFDLFMFGTNAGGRYDPVADAWRPTSVNGVPSGRRDHTAVWTGTEMIVWGGMSSDRNTLLNTGGRYDPVEESWLPTMTDGAPSARSQHTAVWTGTEMIVWGGTDGTGGRYHPVSDTWRPTPVEGAPSSRHGHHAVWTGTEMIVWGGISNDNYLRLNTGARYDPATDTWRPLSTEGAPSGGDTHCAVWTGTEMIVWGMDSGARYRPVSDTWIPLSNANAPPGRAGSHAVWTGSRMIIWGGAGNAPSSAEAGILYVPTTGAWGATTAVGAPREVSWPMAVWTGTEMIVWGTKYDYVVGYITSGGRYSP